jgi:biotin operon repressor
MKRRSRQPSPAERELIQLLRTHPTGQISYENLAAELDYDRRTLISIVARLKHQGALVVDQGSGRKPNRYQLISP